MNTNTQDPGTLFGADVVDSTGNKIGTVDNVWVDDATNELEFVGVKTGWLFGKTHIIPCADAQISDGQITVPYAEDQIKDAPSYGADDELSPEDEQQIYSYYGLDRTTASSSTGLAAGESGTGFGSTASGTSSSNDTGFATGSTGGYTGSDYSDTQTEYGTSETGYNDLGTSTDTTTGTDSDSVRLHEEELNVGKRQVEAGRVRLRKVVSTERQEVPVELQREQVEIERVPVSEAGSITDDSAAFQDQEINVPVMREEAVVGKETRATGEVRLNKTVDTQTETVGGDVRKEDVQVEGNADGTYTGTNTGYDNTATDPEETSGSRF
jgi:uncharacterized protein (TIGR02271 family)